MSVCLSACLLASVLGNNENDSSLAPITHSRTPMHACVQMVTHKHLFTDVERDPAININRSGSMNSMNSGGGAAAGEPGAVSESVSYH